MFDISDLPRELIRYGVGLWRRRWLIVAVAWGFALFGWFLIWLIPDKYESRAQVFVQTETILEPVMSGMMAQPNYQKRVEVMRLQLLTRPNVTEIIKRAGLDKTIKEKPGIRRRVTMEKLVDWVAESIKIESPREMYFVITYKNSDPEIARNVVDSVLNLLIEQDLGASLAEKEEARRRLDQRVAEFDARLTAKEREAADYRRAHADELALTQGNLRQRESKEAEIARVSDDLSQSRRRLVTLKSQLATTPQTSSGDELDDLKVQLAKLRSQYEENYPDIQVLKARIEQLQSVGRGVLPTNPEYTRLKIEIRGVEDAIAGFEARQERIRSELNALALSIGEAPAVEAELQRIIRDYEQTQKTYQELVGRRDRLSLTSSLGAGGQGVEYMVFERPAQALAPSDPPRLILILAAFAFAFAAGGGIAVLFTYLDRTYTQVADLQEAFGLPILGAFSEVNSKLVMSARRADLLKFGGACAGLTVAMVMLIYVDVVHVKTPAESRQAFAEARQGGQLP